ncbi:MAG TPA: GNAT family N-acetyltransferase [Pirellulaceae bacterium]|nr:GNAT family N-acetyltransferase [Pirellulaceae bacterium]HMO93435.1 GNAT family N-acetyltransferase [Pirellulaceae bacterium]HMP68457.1 GNAT family N-acetyltransferase [Pirellulaceae bacterium]
MGELRVRPASELDIPQIVELLKRSLGESLIKKSAEVWRYKHIDNPFGPSIVLLAHAGARLVGVRALMRWCWQRGEQSAIAFRAVDTATDPAFQGRGIFKRLTMAALEIAREQGGQFVFNTPNKQSRPGYLKMGWKSQGKLRLAVAPAWGCRSWSTDQVIDRNPDPQHFAELCQIEERRLVQLGRWFTPKSLPYLQWRYRDCPLQNYLVLEKPQAYCAACIRQHGRVNELRLCDTLTDGSALARRQVLSAVRQWARQHGCNLVTAADRSVLKWSLLGRYGPELTIRNLQSEASVSDGDWAIPGWAYSLGDLELF